MNWYNQLTVTKKLITTFVIVSLIFIMEGVVALTNLNQLSRQTENIYTNNLLTLDKLDNIFELIRSHRLKVFQHIGSNDVKEMNVFRKELEQSATEMGSSLKVKEDYRLTREEDELLKSFTGNWNVLHENYHKVLDLSSGFSKEEAYRLSMTENQKLFDTAIGTISKLHEMKQNSAKADYDKSVAVKRRTWITMMFIVIGGISLVSIIAFFIIRTISQTVKGAVNIISTSSTEIAATVAQHERTVAQQASAVNETTATVEELGTSSRQSAEQAEAAANSAKQAQTVTEEGVKLAERAYGGMTGMKQKVDAVAEQILRLSEQAGQIGSIATVVSELASETNMLALNAAVEAARAGDHGKGFAVVAAEVRKLADQSKKSAQRANALVADIQKATNSAVMVTEAGTKTVEEVAGIAQQAGAAFASLTTIANGVYENAQQVMLNGKQQAAALSQVTEAMKSLGAGSKEIAAGTAQTKIGVQKLNEMAQTLKAMV